ncbi:hypothetical protein BGW37DRAFT_525102 [Umbelopsis sp. PMI_123]|nr:hypothetical protein BGW37DRAFT_525102 [Umbelopsis sp. PMI_123]
MGGGESNPTQTFLSTIIIIETVERSREIRDHSTDFEQLLRQLLKPIPDKEHVDIDIKSLQNEALKVYLVTINLTGGYKDLATVILDATKLTDVTGLEESLTQQAPDGPSLGDQPHTSSRRKNTKGKPKIRSLSTHLRLKSNHGCWFCTMVKVDLFVIFVEMATGQPVANHQLLWPIESTSSNNIRINCIYGLSNALIIPQQITM